jgi:23S rRNA (adenine2503-C2)-methyltransferase
MGFARQLLPNEIFEQAQKFALELLQRKERLSNVVLMGMGEPLANYKNVMEAVRRINTELGIGARHITISTSGLAPHIRTLAEEDIQVGLAISLHQTKDEERSALMPINKIYPISELLDACQYYISRTKRRVTFEWALIKGQTDTPETAHELGKLLKGMLCHVNVIPLNPTEKFGGKPTSKVLLLSDI